MAADHEGEGIHNDDIRPEHWVALADATERMMIADALTTLLQNGVCPSCARFIIYHACERIMSRLTVVGGVRRMAEN